MHLTARSTRPTTPGRGLATLLAMAAGTLLAVAAAPSLAQEGAPPPPPAAPVVEEAPGTSAAPTVVPLPPPSAPEVCEFSITKFAFEYSTQRHPSMPTVEELLADSKVTLTRINEGFVAPRQSVATGEVTLADLNAMLPEQGAPKFSRAAIRAVLSAVVRRLNEIGVIGVIVETDAEDLVVERRSDAPGGEEWTDLRTPDEEGGRTELRLKVYAATIGKVRTVAGGERIIGDLPRVDNVAHERIRKGSPLKPYAAGDSERADLIIRPLLDDYVLKLNRLQGRRVDIAVSGGEQPNEVVLDFLVRENDPLLIYAQVSNTGTKETNIWRERIGIINNQLTGNDDQLSIDYVTGAFKNSNVLNVSYSIPLDDVGDMRLKFFAGYGEFDASAVGQADEQFNGDSYNAGSEFAYSVYQNRELFVDLYAGAKYEQVYVNNFTVQIEGQTNFLLPNIGARLIKETDQASAHADVGFEFNLPGLADTDKNELNSLGRLNTTDNWLMFKYSGDYSFFLEPIFDSDNFQQGESTLAHELFFSLRGQYAFDSRVVPSFQAVAGGFYSVRGYDESVAAGDSAIIGTAEYRLHIPRLYAVEEIPGEFLGKPFRFAPQQPYGRPDWDLIARAFIDAAKTTNSDRLSFEQDNTLVGIGVGIELLYNREINLDLRMDLGMALDAVPRATDEGDLRLHVSATIVF